MRSLTILLLAGLAVAEDPRRLAHPDWIKAYHATDGPRVRLAFERAQREARPLLMATALWH